MIQCGIPEVSEGGKGGIYALKKKKINPYEAFKIEDERVLGSKKFVKHLSKSIRNWSTICHKFVKKIASRK